ncbi:MAG: DinB family protein [Saprospiraceae bacterium]|nr:DinB family protein [Saprospiraceae bacterium]
MIFELNKAIEILTQTPKTVESMLSGLSEEWVFVTEGDNTWSAYDIVGHLIHGEKTDWIPRMEIILSTSNERVFEPFDRFAQFQNSKDQNIQQLLSEFSALRAKNIDRLMQTRITFTDLEKTAIHPAFGTVTLSQLLSTWVVHDLNHIAQISRVLAKQYKNEVGPWTEYLKILRID